MKKYGREYSRVLPHKKITHTFLLLLLGIFLLLFYIAAAHGTGTVMRVSTDSAGVEGNGNSGDSWSLPSISAGGRYVAFTSQASNLVPGDTNNVCTWGSNCYDIFVKDTRTGRTIRVSTGSDGAQGNGDSNNPSISADGRFVAFASYASNLVADDTNVKEDVFVKEVRWDGSPGQTTRVSTDSAGGQALGGNSLSPAISADGRYVAFQSLATTLVEGDTNSSFDVFVKDTLNGETTRVSTGKAGVQGDYQSTWPTISADGRFVAFDSWATNLVPGYPDKQINDVYLKETLTGDVARVSANAHGERGNHDSYSPSLSADGRYVAFQSLATNLVDWPADTGGNRDIFVKDIQTGEVKWISTDSAGNAGDKSSYNSSISADGRYVAFDSDASNLVEGDSYWGGSIDVFVRDVVSGQTVLLSSSAGEMGNNGSNRPAISADGRFAAFESTASNLIPGDTNGMADVFVVTAPAAMGTCEVTKPQLLLSKTKVYWASYADYQVRSLSVDFRVANTGGNASYNVSLVGSTATNGVTSSTAYPVSLGDLPAGAARPVTVKYKIPAGVFSFAATPYAAAHCSFGLVYNYPGPYSEP